MNRKNIRIAITAILVAAVSFWAGGHFSKDRSFGPEGTGARKVLYYTDPMNPGFRSDKPGVAPCGMPLEPVFAEQAEDGEASEARLRPGAVRINPDRQQLIGVRTAVVEAAPATSTLRLYGKIVPDETRVFRVNASTDSWIRDLSDVTTGAFVAKDQILAEALAPSYYNAQVTYLIALDNMDRIKQQLGGELRHQQGDLANNQIRVAVQALQNLGITDAQVEELARTRQARPYLEVRAPTDGIVLKRNLTLNQWFKAADEFYTIAVIRRVWVYADVYENEARHLGPGMAVKVTHAQLGKTFNATVSEVLPLFDPVSKTLKVRLDVANPRYELRPDMFVDVEIPLTMPSSLSVPADAVIDSGTRSIVYVETGRGVFEPRRVETGWRLGRRVQITGGLMSGEKVVVSGNFLIDSESRMKSAASPLVVTTARDPVCGMDVDKEEAERSNMTARLAGKTYYFCMDSCRDFFRKETAKYASGEPAAGDPPAQKQGGSAAVPSAQGETREWISAQQKQTKHPSPAKSSTTARVINWGGSPAQRNGASAADWRGWGKFPGAEYLGLKQRPASEPAPQPVTAATSSQTPSVQTEGSRPEAAAVPSTPEPPASPAPSVREGSATP